MHNRRMTLWLLVLSAPSTLLGSEQDKAAPVKPRQHLLTIEGENNVTFVPAAGLNPAKVEYRARIEYLVKTRSGQEIEADAKAASKKKTRSKPARTAKKSKKAGADDEPPPTVASAVDIAIHAAEMDFLQNGQTVVQSRITRAGFQGRFMPDAPVLSVEYRNAPPPLQDLLKRFDVTAASVLLDDRARGPAAVRSASRARCTRSPRRCCRFTRRFPPTPPSGKPPPSSRWATIKPPRACSVSKRSSQAARCPAAWCK